MLQSPWNGEDEGDEGSDDLEHHGALRVVGQRVKNLAPSKDMEAHQKDIVEATVVKSVSLRLQPPVEPISSHLQEHDSSGFRCNLASATKLVCNVNDISNV